MHSPRAPSCRHTTRTGIIDSLTEDPNGELTIEVPADVVDDNATVLAVDFAPAAVRVGTSLRSGYVIDDARAGAQWMIERARAARDAGLDSLFVGDHHGVPVPYYQNSPMLGRLLAEWDERPVGALYLLPLWNPVLVAEQIGTLAVDRGRAASSCSARSAAAPSSSRAMGADIRRRVSAFEQRARRRAPPLRG